jgi:hypothetical protein
MRPKSLVEPMDNDQIQSILQPIHEVEQRLRRMISRKELHRHLPVGLSDDQKRALVRAWQSAYFSRFSNVLGA